VEIHEPSSWVALSVPRISFSDALVIWISSTAMKAPSIPAATAIQVRASTFRPSWGSVGTLLSRVALLMPGSG